MSDYVANCQEPKRPLIPLSEAASSASCNNSVHEHVMSEVSPGALSSKEGAVHDDGNQMASQKCAVSGNGKPGTRKMVTHVQAEANSMAPTRSKKTCAEVEPQVDYTIQVALARLKGLRILMVQSKIHSNRLGSSSKFVQVLPCCHVVSVSVGLT